MNAKLRFLLFHISGFSNESEFVEYMIKESDKTSLDILAGVVFETDMENITSKPESIKYKIRFPRTGREQWDTGMLWPYFKAGIPRDSWDDHGGDPGIFTFQNTTYRIKYLAV